MLIDRIIIYNRLLQYSFFKWSKFIFIFIISISIDNRSKAFALPPMIDLYSHSDEQNMHSLSDFKERHKNKKATQFIKSTSITKNATTDTAYELKKQIRQLAHALQNSQKQLAAQEKTIHDLREQLLQAPPKKIAVLPSLIKKPAMQTNNKPATPQENSIQDPSSSEWESLKLLLKVQNYREAESALKKFMQQYPKDSRIADAHYLLGQVALVQGKPDQALKEFNTMTRYYPKSVHVPYAHYHRALAYYAKGDHVMAESLFKKLEQSYPTSEAAKQAFQQREQLGLV